jgi:hypothetical protein
MTFYEELKREAQSMGLTKEEAGIDDPAWRFSDPESERRIKLYLSIRYPSHFWYGEEPPETVPLLDPAELGLHDGVVVCGASVPDLSFREKCLKDGLTVFADTRTRPLYSKWELEGCKRWVIFATEDDDDESYQSNLFVEIMGATDSGEEAEEIHAERQRIDFEELRRMIGNEDDEDDEEASSEDLRETCSEDGETNSDEDEGGTK